MAGRRREEGLGVGCGMVLRYCAQLWSRASRSRELLREVRVEEQGESRWRKEWWRTGWHVGQSKSWL